MSTKAGPLEREHADLDLGSSMMGVACDPVQLDAFRDADGKLPANVFQLNRASRGRGRPLNSKNRAAGEYARLHIHKFGDPRDYLGSLWSTPLDQAVELVLAAENYQDREDRLLKLCDEAGAAMSKAIAEGWSAEKLKAVAQMVDAVERAANSMKAKPGDIAVKILSIQMNAAKEAAQYVGPKMPSELAVDANIAFRAIFVGQHQHGDSPVQHVLENAANAVNKGLVSESALLDMRIIDGECQLDQDIEVDDE